MPIEVMLPSQFWGKALSAVIDDIRTSSESKAKLDKQIKVNFSQLRFIKPTGVVFLSNLVKWFKEHDYKVSFTNLSSYSDAIRYLDDAMFFQHHCGRLLNDKASVRSTTLPLKSICHSESHAWIRSEMIPWLSCSTGINESSLYVIQNCISELFNNIKDHTRYDIGSIFIQHFPNKKEITLALSDFGLGIPNSIKKIRPNIQDHEAIELAVGDGFTTKSVPTNAGIGLHYLLQICVLNIGGKVTIYSQRGIVKFTKIGNEIRSCALSDVGFCPGTTIAIDIPTDAIEILPPDREDMLWL